MTDSTPKKDSRQIHLMLKETYPAVFRKPFKPLAIGIHNDLFERHSDQHSLEEIRHYLRGLTSSHFYNAEILKCQEGEPRYNLEGKEEGKITLKGLKHAARMYLRRWERIESPDLKDQMLKKRAEELLGHHKTPKQKSGVNSDDSMAEAVRANTSMQVAMKQSGLDGQ